MDNATPDHAVVLAPDGLPEGNGAAPHNPLLNGKGPRPAAGTTPSEREHGSFWRQPLSEREHEIQWFHPPVPVHPERREEVGNLIGDLAQQLNEDSPYRAWLLCWTFETRAAATQEELEDVERETDSWLKAATVRAADETVRLDRKIEELAAVQAEATAVVDRQQEQLAEALAKSGLPVDAASATPQTVESALQRTLPSLDAVAGQNGVRPASEEKAHPLKVIIFDVLAPLASGFMLALCLGTLTGLIESNVVKKQEFGAGEIQKFLAAGVLGFVLVCCMGQALYNAVGSLSRALEQGARGGEGAGVPVPPRFRHSTGIAVTLLALVGVLAMAEVTAEAMGLRSLHGERLRSVNLGKRPEAQEKELPFGLYFLIGMLISGPYLAYKASNGWSGAENQMRRGWLQHMQNEWLASRRGDPAVREAFRHAHLVARHQAALTVVDTELLAAKQMRAALQDVTLTADRQKRLDDARAAAVGESARLHGMIEQIVDLREPLPTADSKRPRGRRG
jgi:hypothetical protein